MRLSHRRLATAAVLALAALVTRLPAAAEPPLTTVASVPLPGAASRYDYASLDALRNRLFVAHLGAGDIVVFDVRTDRVAAIVPHVARVHGVLVVPQLRRVYATATGTNEVVAIDAASLTIVSRIPGGTYPDGMAYDPAHRKLYVSDEHGDTVTVIDATTNRRTATIALGGDVGNVQFDGATARIYANVQTRGELVAIDPATDDIVHRYPLAGCRSNHGLVLDQIHRRAYVACENNAKLVVFDLRSMRPTAFFDVGDDPDVLAYDDRLGRLYVAAESGTIAVFDAAASGLRSMGKAFLANNAHVVAVDPRSHRVYFPVLGASGPRMIVARPSNGRAVIPRSGDR